MCAGQAQYGRVGLGPRCLAPCSAECVSTPGRPTWLPRWAAMADGFAFTAPAPGPCSSRPSRTPPWASGSCPWTCATSTTPCSTPGPRPAASSRPSGGRGLGGGAAASDSVHRWLILLKEARLAGTRRIACAVRLSVAAALHSHRQACCVLPSPTCWLKPHRCPKRFAPRPLQEARGAVCVALPAGRRL